MQTFLVILLIAAMIATVVALVRGIVTFLHQAFNQHGDMVASCKRSGLQRRKPQ